MTEQKRLRRGSGVNLRSVGERGASEATAFTMQLSEEAGW